MPTADDSMLSTVLGRGRGDGRKLVVGKLQAAVVVDLYEAFETEFPLRAIFGDAFVACPHGFLGFANEAHALWHGNVVRVRWPPFVRAIRLSRRVPLRVLRTVVEIIVRLLTRVKQFFPIRVELC